MISRVPELVAEKFGGEDKINLKEIERQTGLNYPVIHRWVRGRVDRADFDILEIWCEYLEVPVGELLIYEPRKYSE